MKVFRSVVSDEHTPLTIEAQGYGFLIEPGWSNDPAMLSPPTSDDALVMEVRQQRTRYPVLVKVDGDTRMTALVGSPRLYRFARPFRSITIGDRENVWSRGGIWDVTILEDPRESIEELAAKPALTPQGLWTDGNAKEIATVASGFSDHTTRHLIHPTWKALQLWFSGSLTVDVLVYVRSSSDGIGIGSPGFFVARTIPAGTVIDYSTVEWPAGMFALRVASAPPGGIFYSAEVLQSELPTTGYCIYEEPSP